jgi:hypothetical protein
MSTSSSSIILTVVLFTFSVCFIAVRAETADQRNTNSNREAVIAVVKEYKTALQNLTIDTTFDLFISDSRIFEQGGV